MKKILLVVAALFITYFSQAQGIKLGLKAGGNYSNVTGDETEDLESLFGLHAGVILDYGISEMVSIRPELLYSMKGAKLEISDADDAIIKSRFHYLDVPILAHINAGGLFFELGPTVGFKLSSSTTIEVDGEEIDEEEFGISDGDDGMKNFEIGYAAGLGYQLPMGVGIGLRYQGGISSINENDDDPKQRNSVFQLSLSYMFGGR
ncbi:porin family protein [Rufibacter sp. XAAS-G3-1]|uniref:porin family protein n=1 Tax=Rufibacter sp. XAAS-G3-1 TaxID=2729134 RepID=UPI0015E74B70|nr:porin family protein [Rufibacter sp. XAAS-G3-1]